MNKLFRGDYTDKENSDVDKSRRDKCLAEICEDWENLFGCQSTIIIEPVLRLDIQ